MLKYITALLIFLACASPANANYSQNPYTRAVEVAVTYWGRAVPCTSMPAVKETTPPPAAEVSAGPLQSALLHGKAQVEAWVNLSEAAQSHCVIFLSNELWNSQVTGIMEFHKLCNTITHEVGHFLGYEDEGATNPASITYPEETPQNENSVPGCRLHGYPRAQTAALARRVLKEERARA